MSVFKPFRGLRPPAELAEKIASPPYDVIDSDEARKLAEGDEFTFLHVVKPEIDLDPEIDLYDDRVYAKAAENLDGFVSKKWLVQDAEPHFYAYRQRMGDHSQVGLVGCVSVHDYYNDLIKKHEFTRKQKEDDRTRHVSTLNANAGPVFLTYRSHPEIDRLVSEVTKGEPEYDFTAPDGVVHTFWVIDNPEFTGRIEELFADLPCLYVADGHHRSASAARVGAERKAANPSHTGDEEYNLFLAVLFPDDQLSILPYNRAVKDLAGLSENLFFDRIKEKFVVELLGDEERQSPSEPRKYGMYIGGAWYRLTAREKTFDVSDPVGSLDVSILQNNLLAPVLGIEDPRTDERVKFVGGIRGDKELKRLVDSGGFAVAFSLYPTTVEQLMNIADTGNVMPPKSTWFEPKLRSGLVVHLLD